MNEAHSYAMAVGRIRKRNTPTPEFDEIETEIENLVCELESLRESLERSGKRGQAALVQCVAVLESIDTSIERDAVVTDDDPDDDTDDADSQETERAEEIWKEVLNALDAL